MDDAITVTKGNLTDEELGALVAVVAEKKKKKKKKNLY
ncbi:acyl-CoA carboxylase subunit epsilon [Streptomyces sp. G35A]